MKKFVCSLLMCLLISVSAVCIETNPIILIAETPSGPMRTPIPITAVQNDGQLEISFMSNVGWVDISVDNDLDIVVYQDGVDTDLTSYVDIDTSSWPPGDYVLTITLANGTRLIGKFSLQ
jgi:hypothetical protein